MANIVKVKEGVFVYNSSIKEEILSIPQEFHQRALETFFSICGCYSIHLTEDGIKKMQSVMVNPLEMEPGNYVVILEEFFSVLTEEQKQAVIAHELFHISDGHTLAAASHAEGDIYLNLEMELAADRAAVEEVGKEAMASAIVALIARSRDLQCEILQKAGVENAVDLTNRQYEEAVNHPVVVQRLAALQ